MSSYPLVRVWQAHFSFAAKPSTSPPSITSHTRLATSLTPRSAVPWSISPPHPVSSHWRGGQKSRIDECPSVYSGGLGGGKEDGGDHGGGVTHPQEQKLHAYWDGAGGDCGSGRGAGRNASSGLFVLLPSSWPPDSIPYFDMTATT